jgi:hypothetical protein
MYGGGFDERLETGQLDFTKAHKSGCPFSHIISVFLKKP